MGLSPNDVTRVKQINFNAHMDFMLPKRIIPVEAHAEEWGKLQGKFEDTEKLLVGNVQPAKSATTHSWKTFYKGIKNVVTNHREVMRQH